MNLCPPTSLHQCPDGHRLYCCLVALRLLSLPFSTDATSSGHLQGPSQCTLLLPQPTWPPCCHTLLFPVHSELCPLVLCLSRLKVPPSSEWVLLMSHAKQRRLPEWPKQVISHLVTHVPCWWFLTPGPLHMLSSLRATRPVHSHWMTDLYTGVMHSSSYS